MQPVRIFIYGFTDDGRIDLIELNNVLAVAVNINWELEILK